MTRSLMRAVAAFRILSFGYVVVLVATDHHEYSRVGLGWALVAVMAGWTLISTLTYERLTAWPPWLVGLDVAVAVAMVLLTAGVQTRSHIDAGVPTLPAAWAAAPVLAAAVVGGPWFGGLAGLVVSIADVIERQAITQHTFNGVVLLLLAGSVGGYVVRLGQRAEATIQVATATSAAASERERLAREIHDSTLQVLALVSRRGTDLGGEAAELGRLAADQEVALRELVSAPATTTSTGDQDLRAAMSVMANSRVTVSVPAQPVSLPPESAHAVVSAVRQAVNNVEQHAGPKARAWILVEDDADVVVVTVRDDGVGFDAVRRGQALDQGRLGLAQSIVGRIESIGGMVSITSSPETGTEVEIRVEH